MKQFKDLTHDELKNIYHENHNDKAAKILGMSVPIMLRIIKKNKIKLKGRGKRKINLIVTK